MQSKEPPPRILQLRKATPLESIASGVRRNFSSKETIFYDAFNFIKNSLH